MTKPPASPPSSDIAGVHQDRRTIDTSERGKADPGKRLARAETESKGRPRREPT